MIQDRCRRLSGSVETTIEAFISSVKGRMIGRTISNRGAVWLMLEHYQFSMKNPALLLQGAKVTERLRDHRATQVLLKNFNEEKDHPLMYRQGLLEQDVVVESRERFAATDFFLDSLMELIESSPEHAVGALYATESAALLEHQIFNHLSNKLSLAMDIEYESSILGKFHGLHLGGVEEAHARELRVFFEESHRELSGKLLWEGARKAVESMDIWWNALFARLEVLE